MVSGSHPQEELTRHNCEVHFRRIIAETDRGPYGLPNGPNLSDFIGPIQVIQQPRSTDDGKLHAAVIKGGKQTIIDVLYRLLKGRIDIQKGFEHVKNKLVEGAADADGLDPPDPPGGFNNIHHFLGENSDRKVVEKLKQRLEHPFVQEVGWPKLVNVFWGDKHQRAQEGVEHAMELHDPLAAVTGSSSSALVSGQGQHCITMMEKTDERQNAELATAPGSSSSAALARGQSRRSDSVDACMESPVRLRPSNSPFRRLDLL